MLIQNKIMKNHVEMKINYACHGSFSSHSLIVTDFPYILHISYIIYKLIFWVYEMIY
jgi:hypothetical protein